jgi:hypothetical protein
MATAARVLVVGHQRSGTSFTGQVLDATARASYVSEPDQIARHPFAMRALARRGTFPILRAGDAGWPDLVRLWDAAFGVGDVRMARGQQRAALLAFKRVPTLERHYAVTPTARIKVPLRVATTLAVPRHRAYADPDAIAHHVVKSVYGSCTVDWVAARWQAQVVVCMRHPLEVIASFVEVGLVRTTGRDLLEWMAPEARAYARDRYGVDEPTGDDPIPYVAWRVGFVMSWLDDARRAHPEYHVLEHEAMCDDPVGQFRSLVDAVGLEWTADTEALITSSNRPGTGFALQRVASEQRGRWRTRLTPAEVAAASRVLAQFPVGARYADDLTR